MTRLAAVALALALAAGPVHAAELQPVKVGWGFSTAMAPVMIAEGKGYFRRLGLATDDENFRGSADAFSGLATGELDVDLGGVTAGFFNAAARGLDARVVAPLSLQGPAPGNSPLVARTDLWESGAIRSAADLRGRTIAVNAPGNGIEYKLALILESAGMSFSDVNLTRLGFPEMLVGLRTHGIDAAVVAEPFAQFAQEQKIATIMMKESEAGDGDLTTMVLMSGKFLRERRPLAVRYLQGIIAGTRDLQGDTWKSPENVAIIANYLKLDPKVVRDAPLPIFDPTIDIEARFASLERQEAMDRRNHYLDYAQPLDRAAVIDGSVAREAVATMPALRPE